MSSIADKLKMKYGDPSEKKDDQQKYGKDWVSSPPTPAVSDKERVRNKLYQKYGQPIRVNQSFLNLFVTDAKNFIDRTSGKYNSMDYSNSSSVFDAHKKKADELRSKSWNIRQYIETNKDSLDADFYNTWDSLLNDFDKAISSNQYAFYRKKKFFDKFESQEHYDVLNMSKDEYIAKLNDIADANSDLDSIFYVSHALVPIDGYGPYATEDQQRKYSEFRSHLENLWEKYGKDKYDTIEDFYYDEFRTNAGGRLYQAAEEKTKGIAYTTKSGQNLTWEMLLNQKNAQEDLANRLDFYSKNSDWDTLSKGIDVSTDPDRQNDYDIVFELSRANVAYDKETALANGTSEEEWNDIDQKRRYIGNKYGVDLYADIYSNAQIFNELMVMLDDKSWSGSEYSTQRHEKIIGDQAFMNLRHLTKDEMAVLNYIFYTQGRDAALKWHNSRMDIYQARANGALTQEMYDWGKNSWGGLGAFASPANLASVALNIGSALEYVSDRIFGEKNNINARASSAIRSGISNNTDWMIGNFDAYDFLYQNTMSAIDSAAVSFIPGGAAILGLEAAAQATNDAVDRGLSNKQAFWNGIFAGVFEMIFEKWSIGNFKALKDVDAGSFKEIAKNISKSMLVNASEETLTEIANVAYDTFVNADLSQYETMIRQLEAQGHSTEDATKMALKSLRNQIIESGAGGAFMGLGFGVTGSGGAIINNIATRATENSTAKTLYGESQQELIGEALEIDPDNAFAQKMKRRFDNNKNLSGGQLNRLVQQNEATLTAQDMAAIQSAVESRLTKLGETGDVSAIANAIAKKAAGKELTRAENQAVSRSDFGERVANELNPENIRSGEYSSSWAEKIDTQRINVDEYSRLVEAAQQPQKTAEVTGEQVVAKTPKMAQAAQPGTVTAPAATIPENQTVEGSTDDKTIQISSGKEVTPQKITSISNGKTIIQTDNGKIAAEDIAFGNADMDLLWRSAVQFSGITPAGANGVIRAYQSSVPVATYLTGAAQEFKNGYHNLPSGGKYADKLTPSQRTIIYDLGQKAAGENVAKKQAQIESSNKKTATEKTSATVKKGGVYYGYEGQTISERASSGKTLNAKQSVGVEFAERLAKSRGITFYFYESYVNENGDWVYKDKNGNIVKAENGFYDPSDGSIHIDLNAGYDGMGTVLFTISHELVHFIKDWSPKHFKSLANILMKGYAHKNVSVDTLVKMQQANAKEHGRELSYDEAYEEVIADSMETILADGKVMELMQDIEKSDKSLCQKIKEFFQDIVQLLKDTLNAYRGVHPDTVEGTLVSKMDDLIAELQQVFAEGVYEAGENYQSTENKTGSNLSVKMMARENNSIPYILYRKLLNKRSIATTKKDWAKVSDARVDEYRGMSEEDILDIDFLDIAEYKEINVGYVYTIRNYGADSFEIIGKKRIRNRYDGYVMEVSNNGETGQRDSIRDAEKGSDNKRYTDSNRVSGYQGTLRENAGRSQESQKSEPIDGSEPGATYNGQRTVNELKFSARKKLNASVTELLQQENEKLKEDVQHLKDLLKLQRTVTGGTKFTKTSVEAAARMLKNGANARGDTAELAKLLNTFYEGIATDKELSWESVREKAKPAVDWLQSHTEVKPERSEYAKDILSHLRTSRIYLDDVQKNEVAYRYGSYDAYRKMMMGSIILAKEGSVSLDSKWQELSAMYPDVFDSDTTATDMPEALIEAISMLRNSDTNVLEYEYNKDLITQDLLREVYDSYWKVSPLRTFADSKQREINKLKAMHYQRLDKLRANNAAQIEQMKADHRATVERINSQHHQQMEKQQAELRQQYKESKKKAIETRDKREAREKLQKLVLDTVKWITYPSKTEVKCPDILKQPYADFLNSIDLSSQRLANGGDPTKSDLRLTNAMSSLATALDKVLTSQDPTQDATTVLDTGYLDLPANFVEKLRDMTEEVKEMMGSNEYVVNRMPAAEVRKLTQMIRTLNHAIKEVSTLYANLRFANVEALGDNTMSFVDTLGEIEKAGGIKDFVQWDNALPYYAFRRFGEGGESIFEGLMDAQDKLAFLAQKIFAFQEKAWKGKEAKVWSEDTHTIDLPGGDTLTLTTADAMSIYCLSRRQQGLQHLLAGGIRVMGIQKGSKKSKDSRSLLTVKDIDTIISSLTDRQQQVADTIQEFMSTVCSEWGNEISMKRFLTKEFNEKFYFPIESNDENLSTKDPAAQQSDLFRLLNISATKPIDPRANNEVIIRNIFDVFTGHASDMARLNAYGMALLDYMKWLNYREKTVNDDGQIKVRGVRKSMERAYGAAAKSYVLNLVKDVNGRPSDGGDPNILMKWMRAAKTASVGSSLRVATLQVTSYPRAALVLSPKSLALGLTKLPQIEKAKKYCGIALWKSFGFYDTNISRSIEDQMKGVTDVRQKLIEWSLKGAEWGDALTWGCLWNACEYEVAATKKYKVGTEEFYQAVGKKLREVVYRTQVVDSTLTRSQIMRSKRGMTQEAAAFMSEPTLSANILMDAAFQFNAEKRRSGSVKEAFKKTGKYITRAVAVYSIGQLAAALLEGLWDAWRDDEDEEFSEKYWNAFTENLVLDLLPFNKIPIISDVFEAVLAMFDVGFYSSDKMSTTWLTQAVSAVDAWKKVLGGESSTTTYNALYKTVRAISSFFGVSFSGVMREGVALWNNTAGAYDSTLKIRQYDLSKAELGTELYEAIINGDTKQADSLKAQFEDPDSLSSAIRKALRENDPRIKEAAQAQINGDPSERVRIAKQIIADGFKQDDVVLAINAEINAMTSSESSTGTKKAIGFYTASDFALEISNGDYAAANAVKEDFIQTAQKNGKTEEEANKSFNSSAKSELKELFLAGKISEQEVINMLTKYIDMDSDDITTTVNKWSCKVVTGIAFEDIKDEFMQGNITEQRAIDMYVLYGGYTKEKATETVTKWRAERETGIAYDDIKDAFFAGEISQGDARNMYITYGGYSEQEATEKVAVLVFVKKYPECDGISYAAVESYQTHCEAYRVPAGTFYDAWKYNSGTHADVDENGESISGSKKVKVLNYINSLNLTYAQKDSLYYAFGWAESKIYEAPWH